ncbi:MAG: hypothetical protein HY690_13210 [Chloroflexi bacterium]|nr:hypothetical protein [Chloroflexota bacterium]
MTQQELIDYLSEYARHRTRARSAVWWNGELIPVEEALARAAELEEGTEVDVVQGEVIVGAQLERAREVG